MKKILVAVVFLFAASYAPAQTPATPSSGPAPNPVATSLRILLPRQQKNTLAAIEAMPADKFAFKPTAEQVSFAHMVIHIAEFNNNMCSKIADAAAPKGEELKETDSKDKLLAAARTSFDFCTSTLANLDDSKMGDNMDFFGRFQAPRAMAALILASGWADHYGSLAMYLRQNSILPPTAQPKK